MTYSHFHQVALSYVVAIFIFFLLITIPGCYCSEQQELYNVYDGDAIFLHFIGPEFVGKLAKDINIQLSMTTDENLTAPIKDYKIYKFSLDSEMIALMMLPENYQLLNLTFPQYMVLEGIYIDHVKSDNLPRPERVIQIYPRPTLFESVDFLPGVNQVSLNGENLTGAQYVSLRFEPIYRKGKDYEDTSSYPLQTDQINLTIRNKQMREQLKSGKLYLTQINIGAGWLELPSKKLRLTSDLSEGNVIAKHKRLPYFSKKRREVMMEEMARGKEEDTIQRPSCQKIYDGQRILLFVKRSDFAGKTTKDIKIKLSITDEMRAMKQIENYQIYKHSKKSKEVTISILPEQYQQDHLSSPQFILLEDIQVENNSSNNQQCGRQSLETVVQIFPKPKIFNASSIFFHQMKQLLIFGSNLIGARSIRLQFDPPDIIEYEDISSYPLTEDVISLRILRVRGEVEPSSSIPLYLTHIDTGAGWMQLPDKVFVEWIEKREEESIDESKAKTMNNTIVKHRPFFSQLKEILIPKKLRSFFHRLCNLLHNVMSKMESKNQIDELSMF